jgi:hypothetical protein
VKTRWLDDVEVRDYEAALNYLTLKLDPERAVAVVAELRKTELEWYRANDVIRACQLAPLPPADPGVSRVLAKIKKGTPLSPVLVVSYHFGGDIADGYHRVSGAYYLDPFQLVPMRLAHA